MVDDIIEPNQTRIAVARSLEVLQSKRELRPAKKHGLMPL
jgi:acetyl-CoA carboxylase carboxyltransferase component